MGIDLRLEQLKLGGAQVELLHPDIFHQFPDLFHHPVEAGTQDGQLVVAVFAGTHGKISLPGLPRHLAQPLDRLRDILCDLAADQERPHQDKGVHDPAHLKRRHHVRADLFPQRLQVGRFIIDISLDLVLDQLCQDPDVHIQAFHIPVIGTAHQRVLLDLPHPVFQGIQTFQDAVQAVPGIVRVRAVIQFTEILPGFVDHQIGSLRIYQFFRPFRIDRDDVHEIVHIFLKSQVIGVRPGDIGNDAVVLGGKTVHQEKQIDDHHCQGDQAYQQEHIQPLF